MVMSLGNMKFVCKQCGWSKSVYQESDVILGEPLKCPKCGNEEFQSEIDKSMILRFLERLKKL